MNPGKKPADSTEIKNCCAAAYGNDAVALLLGESYHPGGQTLTERLADALDLRAGQQVVDVAAGPGATARLLATRYEVQVDGVELKETTVATAQETTASAGLAQTVRFHTGDAERIPLPDAEFDAVVCECAFCTFPDKTTAAAEFARVLRPGGRVGITDITVHARGLPAELSGLAGWVACIADARPLDDYLAILEAAGLRTSHTQHHDEVLRSMIDMIEARLKVLRMATPDRLTAAGIDVDAVLTYTRLAADAAANGTLGYALITAEKPR
ncbi:class I SAM-dependent methyltransferase [Saccharomonospora halophila]|uniref:class I SAM-dependent methyltransferase n=1 Tax=Saccharomonospora halophila TaxID=129922 RepID=UPI00035F0777|nr:class I SAM-dependent methyltransferase [Saccharomonospora halophila]